MKEKLMATDPTQVFVRVNATNRKIELYFNLLAKSNPSIETADTVISLDIASALVLSNQLHTAAYGLVDAYVPKKSTPKIVGEGPHYERWVDGK